MVLLDAYACNSDVMQAILNPDSILVELVKILNGGQGGTGDTFSQIFVKLKRFQTILTLTGDFSKIITGVWVLTMALN